MILAWSLFENNFFVSLSTIRSYPEHYNVYHELASIPIMNEDVSIQQRVANVFRRVRKFPPAALQVSYVLVCDC